MKKVRVGLIGTGYIGRCHAIAYAQAPTVFPLEAELQLEYLAEITPELAAQKAKEFGFNRSTGNWQDVVNDPNVDVVDICTPNFLHKEIALAAIANGKHVYSEKPLALNADDAKIMYEAAEKAGVKTLVGFNYIKNPTTQLAKEIIEKGEIGEVIHFYGTHNEDYLANPNTPLDWHCVKEKAGLGTLGDLAAHIIQMSQYLVGQDIKSVIGDMETVIKQRPNPNDLSQMCDVENEDQATAMVRFANGCMGTIETSRIACGRKMGLSYVITGTKGTISYTQERMAELKLYIHSDDPARQGFKTILTGPLHPDYKHFCVSAGHGIGFNDQKTVEIRDLINGLANPTAKLYPDFEEGFKISRILDAIALSAKEKRWIDIC
ncbi:Gfo/Idh/MocA family oxidoreductase [Pasteurella skyensis]|uniref:Gfo/Idh/MocA family oxidoreductase n=1 Tax=Phocoenobacter skyensis TaxID=97481 RepID=A0AAJ6NA70_9PAST|nr:Gfo/Idh/MocA family oxidoreductase [Pasteurella skyensis]MDP8162163.1 Gfo/Idh/MocA family oxidoreductase [Pasteurella skyensis]MDP8173022.1 Gfo/Idh/MocA family oxidoreductase [Pasteurella skyensis]MDP8176789.1 Gfo/Idh/MocA family oxidoreductase [Pasteurella skyensis]MDP8179453.1 Gfo/Idh/MocA family oxidoreductase [Pasteurella skyensis]MDP8183693.1 Gfo/Idh/MocA family oxidoreductase [Pasteurella skyensis]